MQVHNHNSLRIKFGLWPCPDTHFSQAFAVVYGNIVSVDDEQNSVRFICEACGTALILHCSQIGVSSPCPVCNTWIDSSKYALKAAPDLGTQTPHPFSGDRRRKQPSVIRKGRIQADGYLDHKHIEQKDLFSSLRVFMIFLAAGAVIFFVILFMR
jgi:predicted RNA-binding Zn-ribbon protein involved in translation (DUF1610 family)